MLARHYLKRASKIFFKNLIHKIYFRNHFIKRIANETKILSRRWTSNILARWRDRINILKVTVHVITLTFLLKNCKTRPLVINLNNLSIQIFKSKLPLFQRDYRHFWNIFFVKTGKFRWKKFEGRSVPNFQWHITPLPTIYSYYLQNNTEGTIIFTYV